VPTVPPLTRIQEGEQALFYGDYEIARIEFESAYRDGSSESVKAAALWGLARTQYADGLIPDASFVGAHPQRFRLPLSLCHFPLGRTNYEQSATGC
jgi:hypothetical protein